MLTWVLVGVLLGVAGLAVLGALTFRLWRQVRTLGREVATAVGRLARASEELSRVDNRR